MMEHYTELFIRDEGYTQFCDKLAELIGVNGAIVVSKAENYLQAFQRTEEDMENSMHYRNGRWWVFNSYAKWHSIIPYLSERTIKRVFKDLVERKILLVDKERTDLEYNNPNWYTVNYDKLDEMFEEVFTKPQGVVSDCHHPSDRLSPPLNNTPNIYNIYNHRDTITKDKKGYQGSVERHDTQGRKVLWQWPSEQSHWDYVDIRMPEMVREICKEEPTFQDNNPDFWIRFFKKFYTTYFLTVGTLHPWYTKESLLNIMEKVLQHFDDIVEWKDLEMFVDRFFEKNLDSDYSLSVFVSDGIMEMLGYELIGTPL